MKKVLILSLVSFSIIFNISTLNAQLTGFSSTVGGTATGFNYNNQPNANSLSSDVDENNTLGGAGGIQLDFAIAESEFMKFSPEFFFMQNGAEEYYDNFNQLYQGLSRDLSLSYIGVYAPFKLDLMSEGTGMTAYASAFMDYAISGTINDGLYSSDIEFASPADRFDYGFTLGIGVASQGLLLDFGYQQGLQNIEFYNSISGSIGQGAYEVNNKGFYLKLGYVLDTDGGGY